MRYTFQTFHKKASEVSGWLARELGALRSGRATPAVLDGVLADSYGAKVPVKNLAAITVDGARTLCVKPFEALAQKEIEKAIAAANLGLSVSADEGGVRVHFPELTTERRVQLVKAAKDKIEAARVNLRRARDEAVRDIEQREKRGEMGEDEKFRLKKELDKLTEAENKKLSELYERKEREVNS